MNDLTVKRCYLCGMENADSVDHIPPKNIFLEKHRGNLITVPAHIKCNKQYELDDEYFRYFLLIPAYWESDDARELWNAKIKKRINRPESRGFKTDLVKHIKPIDVKTSAGIYLGKADVALLDAKRMENVVKRIARGLFYKHTGNILPINYSLKVDFMNQTNSSVRKYQKILENKNKLTSIGNNIFKYSWRQSRIDKTCKFWFTFFNCVNFCVHS